ncbi:hypothetical protein HYPSUDRAFT_49169 [Hypholoma sublateritium FD-334 SS-4]|uniref:Uncharacterized protein n=1 Tax=Hypholoma sublateritium (strain FD-334 SS-4) TaxID=945553 RepID=A0A0D2N5J6_HYPSF|nr:hypothetical protein HYPSUDRAFT_49169 [Hypholoma sublateritium FD-334 SS-4]
MPNMVWLGLYVILVNVYSNSLLVCLNARPQRYGGAPSKKSAITEIRFQSMHTTISIPLYAARSADSISEKDLPPTPACVERAQV